MGETISCEQSLAGVRVDTSARSAEPSLTQIELEEFRTDEGELIAEHRQAFKRFAAQAAHRRTSYERSVPTVYTAADRARFEAHYRDERRRGSEPRFIEDMVIDETIAPMLKGPLTVSNMIGFMLGWGNSLGATNRMLSSQLAAFPQARLVHPERVRSMA